jgi:hypothetical protein
MPRSTYRLTVPQDFYDAVCEACDQPFADSYLFGATLVRSHLTPRTVTAWTEDARPQRFHAAPEALNIVLDKPPLWPGDGSRLSHKDCF